MKRNNIKILNASFISVLLLLSTLTILAVLPTASAFSGKGNGTSFNPYQITNIEQLNEIKNDLSAHYKLMNNLDFNDDGSYANPDNKEIFTTGAGWLPIGDFDTQFKGTFNGNRKTISNLYINSTDAEDVGLFGVTGKDAVIKNVGLINVNINGKKYVGGLIGYNSKGIVEYCYVMGTVSGDSRVGGLIGFNDYKVSNSYAPATVTGNEQVGGLIGLHQREGTASNCYAVGTVNGNEQVGGLIGKISEGNVFNCFYDKQTTGQSDTGKGQGLYTSQMQSFDTFNDAGWDIAKKGTISFKVWVIDDGNDYPRLHEEYGKVKIRTRTFNPLLDNILTRLLDFPMIRAIFKI